MRITRIPIPRNLKLMSMKANVCLDDFTSQDLQENERYGQFFGNHTGRFILLDNTLNESELSLTFIHEYLEWARCTLMDCKIAHRDFSVIATSLHQLLEQLGVRFVNGESASRER